MKNRKRMAQEKQSKTTENSVPLNKIVKESICIAMIRLMEKKPLEEIRIGELCTLAGVSRSSFYRNFESRREVLVYYLNELYREFHQREDVPLEPPKTMEEAKAFLRPRFEFIYEHRVFFQVVRNNDLLYDLWDRVDKGLVMQITGLSADASPYYFTIFSSIYAGVTRAWIDENFATDISDLVELFAVPPKRLY